MLSPGIGQRRVPAGKLRPAVNGFAQLAPLNDLARLLVLRMEAHHQPDAQLPMLVGGQRHQGLCLRNVEAEGLFAEHVLPGLQTLTNVPRMSVHRSGNIDGIEFRRQKFVRACKCRHAESLCHFLVRFYVSVEHTHQLRVRGGNNPLRNGSPAGDSA